MSKDLTFGIDLSAYQTNNYNNPTRFFDPQSAKEKGVQYALIRASIGVYKDKAVDTFAKTFADAGIPVGFYHFGRPETSYIRQADFFWSIIKDYKWELPPALDVEMQGVGLSFTKAFLESMASRSGKTPIVYTSPGFWNSLGESENAVWALDYPLWVANHMKLSYPVYDIPDAVKETTSFPTIPNVWRKKNKGWSFWQFCAAGDGYHYGGKYGYPVSSALDMNVYNGTLFDLYHQFGIGQEPEEPQPPDDPILVPDKKTVHIVKCSQLWGRKQPVYTPETKRVLFDFGERVEVVGNPEHEKTSGITWLPVKLPEQIVWVSKAYTKEV